MWSNYLKAVCFILYFAAGGNASPLIPHFRNDYQYVSRMETFYKVCPTSQRWNDAYFRCAAEGGELAYPRSDSEAALFSQLMQENLPKSVGAMWVGAHDLYAEGVYLTLDGNVKNTNVIFGEDIGSMYENWNTGEPNDAGFDEDCIGINRDTTLNDINCNAHLPAICKKTLDTLSANAVCETADLAYIPNVEGTRCYKIHSQPRNWSQAFAVCHAEQSYLVEINSQDEANFLVKLLEKYPEDKLKGSFDKTRIAVGFTDMIVEGEHITTHGKKMMESGYVEWYTNQPDDFHGEDCGSIYRNGKLNDINCASRMMFICEREIGDPNVVDLFSRFPDSKDII